MKELLIKLARALYALHDYCVHGDLKCDNVMLAVELNPWLINYGVATSIYDRFVRLALN